MASDKFSNHSDNFKVIYQQKKVPIFQNKVYSSVEEAKQAEYGEVELVQSLYSGFIYNHKFDTSLMIYDQNYQNEQANSAMFQNHLIDVLSLLETFDVTSKKLVEIGCGKGYFLELMREKNIDCIGFDPTYEGNSKHIIKEYFTGDAETKADVIILRHTLEHIPNPFTFLHTIAKANQYTGKIFIEVPTFDWIEQKQAFWDVFYEHCNYFTEKTLANMFVKSTTGNFFNGQYIYIWAELADLKPITHDFSTDTDLTINFENKFDTIKTELSKHNKVVIWGAGAKGSTFLNLLDYEKTKVDYVIDINPSKQNKYIAGTGHPIYAPDVLKKDTPDVIWVMNENYLQEIQKIVNNNNIIFLNL